jgi:hypothetical protein
MAHAWARVRSDDVGDRCARGNVKLRYIDKRYVTACEGQNGALVLGATGSAIPVLSRQDVVGRISVSMNRSVKKSCRRRARADAPMERNTFERNGSTLRLLPKILKLIMSDRTVGLR